MTIEIKRTTEEITLALAGRLDTITSSALDKTIKADVEDTNNLVLDIKGIEYISSAGLRVILGAQKRLQKVGSLKVINVSKEIMEVFVMTGLDEILTIE